MVVMESVVSASEAAAASALAAHRTATTTTATSWYDHQAQAEEYLKASNNSYFSQMSSYHSMAHSQHGKIVFFSRPIIRLYNQYI